MKLYFARGTCSFGPHVILNEMGSAFELELVNLKDKKTKSGNDFYKINPKGYVPVLELNDGTLLTEAAIILQYLSDLAPEKKLFPVPTVMDRYKAEQWLNYIATEIHKGFNPIFNAANFVAAPEAQEELKNNARKMLGKKFDYLDKHLAENAYLLGKDFSICDAYLFNVMTWSKITGIDLLPWKNISSFMERVKERPSVQKAMNTERELSKIN